MKKILLLILTTLSLHADNLLNFDSTRRIPFSPQFLLNTWQWDVRPQPEAIHVYDQNDILQTQYEELNGTANNGWPANVSAAGIKVGIIDKGLHGSQVASAFAPRDGIDIEGYAPGAEVVLIASNKGANEVAGQIQTHYAAGVRIFNLSFGYLGGTPPLNLLDVIEESTDAIFFFAAQNPGAVIASPETDGSQDWLCVSQFPNTMCITSHTKGDQIFGAHGVNTVSLAAAGRRVVADDTSFIFDIPALNLTDDIIGEDRAVSSVTGCSLAAPRAAAAAAACMKKFPGETAIQIRERLCLGATTSPYWDALIECGVLNVERALTYCRDYTIAISRSDITVPYGTIDITGSTLEISGPIGGTATVQSASVVTGPWTDEFTVATTGWPEGHFVGNNGAQKFFKFKID